MMINNDDDLKCRVASWIKQFALFTCNNYALFELCKELILGIYGPEYEYGRSFSSKLNANAKQKNKERKKKKKVESEGFWK
jgi:hypothetical protein